MRFEILKREDMNEEQGRLYDEIEAKDGRVRGGPYWAYIRNPEFMRLHNEMSIFLSSSLPLSFSPFFIGCLPHAA